MCTISRELPRLATFLTGFVVLSILFRIGYHRVVGDDVKDERRAQYQQFAAETKILVTGDSRADFGFDPNGFPKSFNYSLIAGNYVNIARHVSDLLAVDNSVETLVVSIAPNILNLPPVEPLEPSEQEVQRIRTLFDVDLREIISREVNENQNAVADDASLLAPFLRRVFPYAGNTRVLWAKLRTPALTAMNRGFAMREGPTHRWRQDGQGRASILFRSRDKPSYSAIAGLLRTIDECHRRNIEVVLVRWPVMAKYANAAAAMTPEDSFRAVIARILQSVGDVKYIDAHDLYYQRNDLFADVDHLNERGALEFATFLATSLQRMREDV